MTETYGNYINGQWTQTRDGKIFESRSPATGELVARAQDSTATDVQEAIDAARAAFEGDAWRNLAGKERAALIHRFADLVEENAQHLGEWIAREMGKPIRTTMEREVMAAVDRLRFYASAARMVRGEVTEAAPAELLNIIRKEPVGVCALILPWNDPVELPMRKLGAALAAGCTVIVKAASDCAAATMEIFKLLDRVEGLPPGVVNAVTGRGEVVGPCLAENPGVDKVSFTGSTATGRHIMASAAGNMKKVSLECGGKAPFVLFADANLDKALDAVTYAAFAYAGQSCSAVARLLVEKKIHAEFTQRVVDAAGRIELGDPLDPATMVGPLVSEHQMNTVLGFIQAGVEEGADLRLGGHRSLEGNLAKGFYVPPTIFDGVTPEMTVFQEEIFGPVLCVTPFEDEAEAVRLANHSHYGLQSAVWSADVNRCLRMSQAIRAGDILVNSYYVRLSESPYGGVKQSGLGVELGMQGVEEYLVNKRICFDVRPKFHTHF